MPADLAPGAKDVWERVLRDQAPGVILAAHADVLRLYCEAVVRYLEASALLAKSGLLLRGARGSELVRNPLVGMVRDASDQVRVLGRELGLTPSSLSGVHAFGASDEASRLMSDLSSRRRII
jgi:P27 family predicted phage terminase small subunit